MSGSDTPATTLSYSWPVPNTLISVRPVEAQPGAHLAAAVAGHAQIMATVTDHLNRAYAHHDQLATAVDAGTGQSPQ